VALLIDTSGSIRPQDLAKAREISRGLLEGLPPDGQIALFTFDDQSRLVLPRTSYRAAISKAVEGVHVAGQWTALNDALYDAGRYLRDAPSSRKAIVLITDGLDENSAVNLDDALSVAQASAIPVYAVGVGHAQDRILRRIAKLTSGEYESGEKARGEMIAGSIARLSVTPSPIASPATAALGGLNKREPAPAGPAVETKASAPSRLGSVGLLVGAGVVLIALVAATATRRRAKARCPTCGRELPDPLATCVFCAAKESEVLRADSELRSDVTLPPVLGDTVMARLDGTEEFLEKTITLRENPFLTITKGPGQGQLFPIHLRSPTSLGRAKANDIVLSDVAISSQHCRIRVEEGRFILHDLRSTNGTYVNEKRVSRYALNEGDTIKIGETSLLFRVDQKRS
jgi:hypothetical protein